MASGVESLELGATTVAGNCQLADVASVKSTSFHVHHIVIAIRTTLYSCHSSSQHIE